MAIENADLLAYLKEFRRENKDDNERLRQQNRAEHILINDGIAGCRERIACLEHFRDDTKPRLNGFSTKLAAVNEEKAQWSGFKKVAVAALLAALGAGVTVLVKYLLE